MDHKMHDFEILTTTSAVMDALDGIQGVAKITGRTPKAAWNWIGAKTFPSDTYVAMRSALQRKGKDAPPSLWRMVEVGSDA